MAQCQPGAPAGPCHTCGHHLQQGSNPCVWHGRALKELGPWGDLKKKGGESFTSVPCDAPALNYPKASPWLQTWGRCIPLGHGNRDTWMELPFLGKPLALDPPGTCAAPAWSPSAKG